MKRVARFRIVLTFFLTGIIIVLNAQQLKNFSSDSTKFIGELNQLFLQLSKNDKKIVEGTMVPFIQHWESEHFDAAKKKSIYSVCNKMLKKTNACLSRFL